MSSNFVRNMLGVFRLTHENLLTLTDGREVINWQNVEPRFWPKIEPAGPESCWRWTAATTPDGYGKLNVHFTEGGRSMLRAHRLGWVIDRGPIPDGLVLDHLCRVRHCVNPAHLRVVSQRDNILAPGSVSPTARNAAATHCVHGHPFDEANTMVTPDGGRRCRTCHRERKRAAYRARRARARTAAELGGPDRPAHFAAGQLTLIG